MVRPAHRVASEPRNNSRPLLPFGAAAGRSTLWQKVLVAKVIEVEGFFVEVDDGGLERPAAPPPPDRTRLESTRTTKTGAPAEDVLSEAKALKETIAAVCVYVRDAFDKANKPHELQVKFGVKLSGEAGIPYLTKASGEAVLEVRATWKNHE